MIVAAALDRLSKCATGDDDRVSADSTSSSKDL
jgi:hypothetical protein